MRIRLALALCLVTAMLVTGCTAEPDAGETNLEHLPAADVNRQDRGALASGGELRLAVDEVASLNPMSADSSAELARAQGAFLPTFFRYDEQGLASPNTNFLESATETSADPTQVTLRLNPNAAWADGTRITAGDVFATWAACNGRTPGFRCAPDLGFDQIADVAQGASESEVQLSFTGFYPEWRGIFDRVSVLRADSVRDPETFNAGWATLPREWTSGPFVVNDHTPETGAIVATPNPEWWGADPPLLARYTIHEIARANHAEAYSDAEIDVLSLDGSQASFDTARTAPETSIRRAGAAAWRQLVFNTAAASPVGEIPVRRAIAMALDRSGVGTAAYAGQELLAAPQGNRIFLPQQEAYVDNAETLGMMRDLDQARELLDDAAWQDAEGVRSRDGQPLEVRLVHVQGLTTFENEARAITEQLARVGVRVIASPVPYADFVDGSALAGNDYDLVVVDGEGGRHPLQSLDVRFGSGSESDYARSESPEVDDLVTRIATETDAAQRAELANQLDALLWQSMPTTPLYQLPQSVAAGPRLANFGAPGLSSTTWENVGFMPG